MNKKTIFIAEDEVAYGKILKNTLEKKGYDVSVALNGDKLLRMVQVKKPDLILLDLIMPVMNGFQVLAEMKKDSHLKNLKVIALSNLGQAEDIAKAKKLGADEYITKSDEKFYTVIHKIEQQLN